MQRVAIVADTTALPARGAGRAQRHPARQPLRQLGGRQRARGRHAELRRLLRRACAAPTACRPPPSPRSATSWRSTSRSSTQGRDVVSIHISGGISGTVESARQAKEQLAERKGVDRVTVIDSRARGRRPRPDGARRRAGGAGAAGRCRRGRRARRRRPARDLKMWFAVDTLEYLRRGGRIGAASAWLGSALKIKPILTLDKEITPIERVRTGAKAMRRLLEYVEQRHADGARRLGRPARPGARGGAAAGRRDARDHGPRRRCSCPRSGR